MKMNHKADVAPVSGQHEPDCTGYGSTIQALKARGYSLGSNNELWWLHGGNTIARRDGKNVTVADLITGLVQSCNAHEKLAEACQAAYDKLCSFEFPGRGTAQGQILLCDLRDALALVEGK